MEESSSSPKEIETSSSDRIRAKETALLAELSATSNTLATLIQVLDQILHMQSLDNNNDSTNLYDEAEGNSRSSNDHDSDDPPAANNLSSQQRLLLDELEKWGDIVHLVRSRVGQPR